MRRQAKAKKTSASKKTSKTKELVLIFAILIFAELILDAIAGEYIKDWINQNIGTIPAFLGFLALIAAVVVRVWKWEEITRKRR